MGSDGEKTYDELARTVHRDCQAAGHSAVNEDTTVGSVYRSFVCACGKVRYDVARDA